MTKAADVRLSEDQKNAREERDSKRAVEQAKLRKDLNETFATAAGLNSLRWLMEMCGYQRPSIIADPANGNPLTDGTIYNEARRNLYLSLRKFLKSEILIPVENRGLQSDEDIFS